MCEYFKDYSNLCKELGKFYKKHWLGTIIMYVLSIVLTWLTFGGYGVIKNKVNEIKAKKKVKK